MTHSPAPWVLIDGDRFQKEKVITTEERLNGGMVPICEMDVDYLGQHGDEQKANVRRIVACVNACEGIPTDYLESPDDNAMQIAKRGYAEIVALRQQRDELLAALKDIVTSVNHDPRFVPDVTRAAELITRIEATK